MLEFVKKLFQKEEPVARKAIEIQLQNLEEWISERSKPLMEEVNRQTEAILMKVDEETQRTRFNIEVLDNSKLQNPNIPFKAKQYMEGNRKAYIRAINSFLGHMEINNRDYFYLADFCTVFEERINELNKDTVRSYTILQEFFANETGKIAQNLRNFDVLFSELGGVLNDEKMVNANKAVEMAKNLKSKIKQRINLDVDFKNIDGTIKQTVSEKEKIMADIEKFSKSGEHSKFIDLSEQKKNKMTEFYTGQNNILQSFSVLERSLRKYSHFAFEHEEIVLEYLKDPIETLVNDKNMKILEVFRNLEKALNEGKIDIDEKKKEKAIEEIKKLNKDFIEQFVKKYFSFKSEIEELEKQMKATGVTEKFRNFNKQLEDANLSIEKNNEEYNKLKNDIERLDKSIENLRGDIGNSLSETFNEEVKVAI